MALIKLYIRNLIRIMYKSSKLEIKENKLITGKLFSDLTQNASRYLAIEDKMFSIPKSNRNQSLASEPMSHPLIRTLGTERTLFSKGA